MLAITSGGQLIAALVMIVAIQQSVFATARPLDEEGERSAEQYMQFWVAIAVIAVTVFVILGAKTF